MVLEVLTAEKANEFHTKDQRCRQYFKLTVAYKLAGLEITLPAKQPCKFAFGLKIKGKIIEPSGK